MMELLLGVKSIELSIHLGFTLFKEWFFWFFEDSKSSNLVKKNEEMLILIHNINLERIINEKIQ